MRHIKKGKRMNTKKIILLMFLAVGSGKIMAMKPVAEGQAGKAKPLNREIRNSESSRPTAERMPTPEQVAQAKALSDFNLGQRQLGKPEISQQQRTQSLPLKSGSAENIPTSRPQSETISGSRNPAIGQRSIEFNVAKQNIADALGKQQNPETATNTSKWEQRVQAARDYLKLHNGNKPDAGFLTAMTGVKPKETTTLSSKSTAAEGTTATWSNLPKRTMDMLFQKSQVIRSPQEAKAVAEQTVTEAAGENGVTGDAVTPTQKTQLQRLVSSASTTVQSGWNALQFKAWADSISSAVAKIFTKSNPETKQSNENATLELDLNSTFADKPTNRSSLSEASSSRNSSSSLETIDLNSPRNSESSTLSESNVTAVSVETPTAQTKKIVFERGGGFSYGW